MRMADDTAIMLATAAGLFRQRTRALRMHAVLESSGFQGLLESSASRRLTVGPRDEVQHERVLAPTGN